MAFLTMADNNIDIMARQDGALYNVALGGEDFIIKGIGDEMAYTVSGVTVTVSTGEAIIHGRHVTANETNTLELPTNSEGFVVLRFDLTQTPGNEAYLYATPVISTEEINWIGTIHDMVIASFRTTSTTATLEDRRKIISSASSPMNKFEDIPVSATPIALGSFRPWDTQHLYPYYFDVTINGLTETSIIENIIMTDTLLATVGYIATTMSNKLRFYTQTNDSVSGTIITLITSEV